MSVPILEDAFAHHVWATLRLIDASITLSPDQLASAVPGMYGSILETQRHLVGSDARYPFTMTSDRGDLVDEDHMSLAELRTTVDRHGGVWSRLLEQDVDPDAVLEEVDEDDGYQKRATVGIRLAQALHHGTDHRSQICTALTTLGVEPPSIDVWDFGSQDGRVIDIPASS